MFTALNLRSRTWEPPSGQADFGLPALFSQVLGRGTCRKRSGTAVGFIWVDSRGLATILDPFRTIFVHLRPDRLSETSTSVLSQQQTSVLSQQQTSVLSQQQTRPLWQEQKSVLSQHPMLKSQKSQLSQCHIVEVSEVSIVAMSQCLSPR